MKPSNVIERNEIFFKIPATSGYQFFLGIDHD